MVGRGSGRHRRHRPRGRRWLLRALLLVVGVAGLVVVRGDPLTEPRGPDRGGPATAVDVPRWEDVVVALDRRRAEAFTTGTVGVLDDVYVDGSAAGRRDRSALQRLVAAGLRVERLDLRVVDAEPVQLSPDRVVLRVVDELAPYRLLDPRGGVVATRPGRTATAWTVTLARSGVAWRVVEVARSGGVSDRPASDRRRALGAAPARTRGH